MGFPIYPSQDEKQYQQYPLTDFLTLLKGSGGEVWRPRLDETGEMRAGTGAGTAGTGATETGP
jgi:hypothetical protein